MAKHLEGFTRAFADSGIPFVLAEVVTNGSGEMVDLIFRFTNRPAATLFGSTPEAMKDLRFTRACAADHLRGLEPLAQVAFSGSAVSFSYQTVLGKQLTITGYQPMYGMAGCILEAAGGAAPGGRNPAELLANSLPGGVAVLELGARGMRILSFNRGMCGLSGFSRKEFFNRFALNALPLIHPDDQAGLLQNLMDAARDSLSINRDIRLLKKNGSPFWINLRADVLVDQGSSTTFYAILLDIDQSHREREALAEVSRKAEVLERQYAALLDSLPGGYCVLRCQSAATLPQVEQISGGLCRMTGYSEKELLRHMGEDPLWLIHPDDRDAAAAAIRNWRFEGDFCRVYRIRHRGDGELLLSVSAAARLLPDGQWRIFAACTAVSEERSQPPGQRFHAEVAELLLENENFISIDYDPIRDIGRLEFHEGDGRRTERVLPEYRKTLPSSPTIHSGDRKRVQSALRQAVSRPLRATLEYLGSYGDGGYQWYRASYVSLTDDQGTVCRIVGKIKSIHSRRASEERFSAWAARQKSLCGQALCSVRLDLTADRLLDAKGSGRHLTRALFGNSAEECLQSLSASVPDGQSRGEWTALLGRTGLLDSFRQGSPHLELSHRLQVSDKSVLWVLSTAELAENPQTGHVESFLRCTDRSEDRRRAQLDGALLRREYDFVLTINARTKRCRVDHGAGQALPVEDADFAEVAEDFILTRALPEDRELARTGIQLPEVIRQLITEHCCEFSFRLSGEERGPVRREYCRFSWLDDQQETLLLTGRSIPSLSEGQ